MSRNVEIKARVREPEVLERRVQNLGAVGPEILAQEDVFFPCARGRLKLRVQAGEGELIFYARPDGPGPRTSVYCRGNVADPGAVAQVLGEALGMGGTVRKVRKLYILGRTRIHLDAVEELGTFLELEVVLGEGASETEGAAEARELLQRLGVESGDLVERAYVEL